MRILQFYADPGHSWLKVSIDELFELEIESKISHYSYMHGNYAYLEEDCDAQILIDALFPDGIYGTGVKIKHRHAKKTSIRGFEIYHVRDLKERVFMACVKGSILKMNLKDSARKKVKFASYDDCKFWNNHFGFGYSFE